MKKLFLLAAIIFALAQTADVSAATGDISARVVSTDGWTVLLSIDGFTSGATYAFGYNSNNVPSGSTPFLTVVSKGYTPGTTTLATTTRTIYLDKVVRFPFGTAWLTGTYTSGTFVDGETVTQATSGATGIIVGNQASGARLVFRAITGTFDNSHVITGGTSAATFTSSSVATVFASPTNHELVTSTGLTVRVALSQPIFVKDNSGGGNSGTAPTITIPASFVTNSGGGAQTSAILSAAAVTQNSTLVYAPCTKLQWDHIAGVRHADRVTGAYNVAVNANAPYGVAAVRFDATGRTSTTNVNATVGTQVSVIRSATGLYEPAYQTNFTVSGFTTGELIDLRARVYPLIGDTTEVLDTDNFTTVTDEPYGYTKATIVYNSTPKYAYVDTAGNDGTGVASTTQGTASASPFLSIGKAIQNDATVIYLNAGTHPAVRTTSSTRRTTNEWYVVQPAPGQSSATVTYQLDTVRTYRCQRLRIEGVTVTLQTNLSYLDGESNDNNLLFTNCIFNHGAVTPTSANIGYQSNSCKFENCTGDLGVTNWAITNFSTARVNFQFDGCTFSDSDTSNAGIGPWYRVVACSSSGPTCFIATTTGNPSPIQDNVFFEHNKFTFTNIATYGMLLGDRAIVRGASIRGNVIEQTSGGQPYFYVCADNSIVQCDGIQFESNTLGGGRFNCGYNSTGTTSFSRNYWSIKNNLLESWATKHDTFATANGNRTGGWPVLYGVNASGNFSPHIAGVGTSGTFLFEFVGVSSYQPAITGSQPPQGNTNVIGYVQFTNRQAYTGSAGAGGGSYTLQSTSPARSLQLTIVDPTDILGHTRVTNDDSGGYAFVAPANGNFLFMFR